MLSAAVGGALNYSVCSLFQCFIELGTSIPESGAELAYINYMGWYPLGFSILWLTAVFQGYFFLTNKNYGLKSHLMKKE